jgi:hypothetical protein
VATGTSAGSADGCPLIESTDRSISFGSVFPVALPLPGECGSGGGHARTPGVAAFYQLVSTDVACERDGAGIR